ncbi:hypothetical protein AB1Y20_011128 [Prymnesium parvum]|uniref:Uncharacterized protein n=1 Tax=Prymnesium parvum TaxID=97485 RepID=A0AB34ILZ4_PRYPA
MCYVIVAFMALLFSEGVLRQVCSTALAESLVMKKSNVPGTLEWTSGTSGVLHLYNLTNGFDILRRNPPPKPIFQEVSIKISVKVSAFDFEVSDSGESYSYKNFFYIEATNKADNDLVFVNINSVLLEALSTFPGLGSEAAVAALAPFVPDFAALAQAMDYDFYFARNDGTGPLGAGIFKRLTVREVLHGYFDPLFALNLTQGLQKGRFNVYPTRESLQVALNASHGLAEPSYIYTDVRSTGKGNVSDAGRIVSLKGLSNFSKEAKEDPLSGMEPPGWDITGNWNDTTRQPLVYSGLRSWAQPLPPISACPSCLDTMSASIRAEPSALNFTIFDDRQGFLRNAVYTCSGPCKGEKIHDALWVHKYELGDDNWKLKVNGRLDEAGNCSRPPMHNCDYAMRHQYIMESRTHLNSAAFSLPYFGNVSDDIANATIVLDSKGNRPTYNRDTMGDKVWVDPLSGTAFKYRSDVNRLTPIDKSMWNSPRHANIFAGGSLDRMYWPYYRYAFEIERTEEDTREIVNSLGMLYTMMLWLTISAGAYLIWKSCFGCCIACPAARQAWKNRKAQEQTKSVKILVAAKDDEEKQACTEPFAPLKGLAAHLLSRVRNELQATGWLR